MLLAEVDEVIKASPAIQIQGRITHLQRRAWNVLLANAYNQLPDKEIHRVSVVELAMKLGFDSNNHEYLKETLEALVDCTVKWNILGKNKKEIWGAASLLAEVRIEDGICFYQYTHTLRQKLHNPLMYTKLNLRLQNRFKSQYALILWEVCFDYFDVRWDRGETPFIPIETFRGLMGLESDEYTGFAFLNRDVIKPAIKEINALTNYHVEVEQKRLSRKVAELKFRITRIKELPVPESVFPDIENLPPVAVELVQAKIDRKMALQIADKEWDFVNPEKLPVPGSYADFLSYISEKLEMSVDAASVKNRAGYIVEAIRENYQDPELQKQREVRAEKAKEKELEDLTEGIQRQAKEHPPASCPRRSRTPRRTPPPKESNLISSVNGLMNNHLRWLRIRRVAWWRRRSTPSSRRNSVRSCSPRLLRRMRMRKRGYWDRGWWSVIV